MSEVLADRARAWRHSVQGGVCDVLLPWAHGTVARATRYPGYFDFNVVRVEEDPTMSLEDLCSFADHALAGLEHRRLDFERVASAERLRAAFEAQGWRASRLVCMRQQSLHRARRALPVAEVSYEVADELRRAWHVEDSPDQDPDANRIPAREVALLRHVRVLAVFEAEAPVAFAHLERDGPGAEITQVYVRPDHRGRGFGRALVLAAGEAAGDVRDLWIGADQDDWPKQLYHGLGFRPVWTTMEFLRMA